MKCIKCATDNKLKERTNNKGCCKQCKHPFVFDPKGTGDATFTDPFFANAISTLSAQDSLFFTPKQFYYFLNARLEAKKNPLIVPAVFLFFLALVTLILTFNISLFFGLLTLGCLAGGVILLLPATRRRMQAGKPKNESVPPAQVETYLHRWQKANGAMAKLLPPPATGKKAAPLSSEVTAYSFDRVVVCQHASVAQFLIANNFHFEHNCAVLSLDKYPHNLFDTVMEMLRRNPELKVYALHDASPDGIQMTHHLLNDPHWFAGQSGVTMYDLGLLPRQLLKRSVFVREDWGRPQPNVSLLPAPVRSALQPEEVKWLEERKYVELESIAPQRLLKIVTLGIAQSRNPNAVDTLVPVDVGDSYGGGIYVYSSDSFG